MSTDIVTVHEAELVNPRQIGGRLRAFCNIPPHQGDHQRSLSIALEGDAAGYGYCHSCHATVFVPELNPDGERALGSKRPRHYTPERFLRAPRPTMPTESTPDPWQRDELKTLQGLADRMYKRLADERARAYLDGRAIPYDVAEGAGVGYVPADAKLSGGMAKWRDRLVFPLASPSGAGYTGRCLHLWQPGMDENEHKALLDALTEQEVQQAEAARKLGQFQPVLHRRWYKTNPAGWYGYELLAEAERVVICEGALDRLALIAAGLPYAVAVIGTAIPVEWIPANVRAVVLALDGDVSGRKSVQGIYDEMRQEGLDVAIATPPAEDGRGKDWSERWRVAQWDGVAPVFDAWDDLAA